MSVVVRIEAVAEQSVVLPEVVLVAQGFVVGLVCLASDPVPSLPPQLPPDSSSSA